MSPFRKPRPPVALTVKFGTLVMVDRGSREAGAI